MSGASADAIDPAFALSPVASVARAASGADGGAWRAEIGADSGLPVAEAPRRALLVAATAGNAEPELWRAIERLDLLRSERLARDVGAVQALGFARLGLSRQAGTNAD